MDVPRQMTERYEDIRILRQFTNSKWRNLSEENRGICFSFERHYGAQVSPRMKKALNVSLISKRCSSFLATLVDHLGYFTSD